MADLKSARCPASHHIPALADKTQDRPVLEFSALLEDTKSDVSPVSITGKECGGQGGPHKQLHGQLPCTVHLRGQVGLLMSIGFMS